MTDLIHYLAPFGLVLAGLVGMGLGLDHEACGGVILCGLTLINPSFRPKTPTDNQGT